MKRIIFLIALLPLFISCNEQKEQQPQKKAKVTSAALSAPYELLIVANKEWLKTSYGEQLLEVANPQVAGIPQIEPNFRITSVNPNDMSGRFTTYANILCVDINPKYTATKMAVARDVYVRPQTVLTIQVPDNDALAKLLAADKGRIAEIFIEAELKRERDFLVSTHSGVVYDSVKNKFGYTIFAPQDIDAVNKSAKDFLWASSNKRDNQLNLCIYTYPYTSDSTFTLPYFLYKRNSIMEKNIRGNKPEQYMTTEERSLIATQRNGENGYIYEVRGLWEMENDMMGGPFVSYSQVDTVRNLVVVAEGFVYAPKKKKRDFIREMEAAVQTLKIVY